MNKRLALLLFAIAVFTQMATSQTREPDGGGDYRKFVEIPDEITPQQRASIIKMLQSNETKLRREGKFQRAANIANTGFAWPLKQAPGFNDNGYYAIINYVDENTASPAILDYNCGNRTYDGHGGTDIINWPFWWQKMERNAVQIIAAAPGTILAKSDSNFDHNCAFCSSACQWNAVYVMQADGSVAWYGHMKSGSLTTKAVGETVALGEYLGIVGSSGNSTYPHLHIEMYTNSSYKQRIDPWAGTCNNLNGLTSWWANQQPYRVSTLNKIMTHSATPSLEFCPAGEISNEKINFSSGETVYLGSYYRDQLKGDQSVHTVYKPDNSVYLNWTQNNNSDYSASWWYYTINLPNPAPSGTWKYEVVYKGLQRLSTYFAVNSSYVVICPGNYNVLTSNISGSTYQWQVNSGSGFGTVINDPNYAEADTKQIQLKNLPSSFYGYQYRCLIDGSTYSNTISLKYTSYWTGSADKAWENAANWSCGNIPDANTDVVISGTSNAPEVNSNATCRSFTVNPGMTIKVNPGFKLNVTH